MNAQLLAVWLPGATELIVIGVVGLLLFGRRLPDVARSMGRSIVEFKKGIRDAKDDVDLQSRLPDCPEPSDSPQREPIQHAPDAQKSTPPEQSAH